MRIYLGICTVLLLGGGKLGAFDLSSPPFPVENHVADSVPEGISAKTGSISATRAAVYSLVLPGWGQLYLGERGAAKVFFLTEAAVWTAFVTFRGQGRLREDAYRDYAITFAGISSRDHSDQFYRIIGDFNSDRDYEAELKAQGRYEAYFENRTDPPADLEALRRYYLDHRVSDFEPWSWRSRDNRLFYHRLRSGSRQAYRRSTYCLAMAVVVRVASAVMAVRSARAKTRGEESGQWGVLFEPNEQTDFRISLTRRF